MNWWEKEPERLQTEVREMDRKFPQFKLGKASQKREKHGWTVANEGQKYWVGKLKTVSGEIYSVVAVYPQFYPGQEIKSFVVDPYIQDINHRYGDGHLCLYSNDHNGRGQGAGKGMTAVSYISWTAAWLHAFEIYEKTGNWPENTFFDRS